MLKLYKISKNIIKNQFVFVFLRYKYMKMMVTGYRLQVTGYRLYSYSII